MIAILYEYINIYVNIIYPLLYLVCQVAGVAVLQQLVEIDVVHPT